MAKPKPPPKGGHVFKGTNIQLTSDPVLNSLFEQYFQALVRVRQAINSRSFRAIQITSQNAQGPINAILNYLDQNPDLNLEATNVFQEAAALFNG